MQHSILFMLVVQTAALYITAPLETALAPVPLTVIIATTSSTSTLTAQATPTMGVSTNLELATPSVPFSSLMTIAPLSRNPLELRQKCFNDQGFSVNCATWTGYYYTWGGYGHPYAGGPGDGSSSNSGGRSNNAITGIIGSANKIDGLKWPVLVAIATLTMLLML